MVDPPERASDLESLLSQALEAEEAGLRDELRRIFGSLPGPERDRLRALLDLHRAAEAGLRDLQGATGRRLGEFRVLAELGRGGTGVVYLAERESFGQVVALKVLDP